VAWRGEATGRFRLFLFLFFFLFFISFLKHNCFCLISGSIMAKRQKSIRDAHFAKSCDTDSSTSENNISVQSPTTNRVICREKGGRSVYAKDGSKNFKISAFTGHSRSNEHQRLAWASTSGEKTMEKAIFVGQRACDEALQTLFKAAYFTWKQSLPYSKFPALCKLLMFVNAPITASMYQDEKACSELIFCISTVIQ
jgi:hypothetical protein